MIHEKIIKRPTGKQYKITVNIIAERLNTVDYRFDVYYREKGGRNWNNLPNTLYENMIRTLSLEARNKHRITNILRFVSEKEIQTALTEAWARIEPIFTYERCECTGCSKSKKYEAENIGYYDPLKHSKLC